MIDILYSEGTLTNKKYISLVNENFSAITITQKSFSKANREKDIYRSRIKRYSVQGIVLEQSDNDNGLLTAEEILKLNLNAELVVLSAISII